MRLWISTRLRSYCICCFVLFFGGLTTIASFLLVLEMALRRTGSVRLLGPLRHRNCRRMVIGTCVLQGLLLSFRIIKLAIHGLGTGYTEH